MSWSAHRWFEAHPRVTVAAGVLLLWVFPLITVRDLAVRRGRMSPSDFWGGVGVGALWVVGWVLLLVAAAIAGRLRRRSKGRERRKVYGRVAGAAAIGAAVIPVGALLMTYSRFGPDPVNLIPSVEGVPRLAFVFGSYLIAGGLILAYAVSRWRRGEDWPTKRRT